MYGSIPPVTIPPPGMPPGFAIFSFLGGIFPTPGHAERHNSSPSGLFGHALHSNAKEKTRLFVYKIKT